jgi:hypothetical protein
VPKADYKASSLDELVRGSVGCTLV